MNNSPRRTLALGAIIVSFLASFVFAAYPLYVIRPFRHQGPRELAVALAFIQARPWVELSAVVLALAALALIWRRALAQALPLAS